MATFVLEIGSEELPARFLAGEEAELAARFTAALQEASVEHGALRTMSTPRRAIVIIEDTPRLRDAVRDFHARVADDVTALLERGEMPPALGEYALDFAGVEFMDSSGIGLVLGRYRLMQEMNGKLVLRAMPPHIRRVMRVAGIASLEIEEESRV